MTTPFVGARFDGSEPSGSPNVCRWSEKSRAPRLVRLRVRDGLLQLRHALNDATFCECVLAVTVGLMARAAIEHQGDRDE